MPEENNRRESKAGQGRTKGIVARALVSSSAARMHSALLGSKDSRYYTASQSPQGRPSGEEGSGKRPPAASSYACSLTDPPTEARVPGRVQDQDYNSGRGGC